MRSFFDLNHFKRKLCVHYLTLQNSKLKNMNPKLTRVTAQFCLVLQLAVGGIMPVASASPLIKKQ